MATPTLYSTVYNSFLGNINDYILAGMTQAQSQTIMNGYLTTACALFTKCRQDLTQRSDASQTFNITLTDLEVTILGIYMTHEWIEPQMQNILLLKQVLNSSDFKLYSQANHLDQLMKLHENIHQEAEELVIKYQYATQDFTSFS